MKLTSLEDGLRESEERFRQLANSTFEGIIIHEHGTIIDVNQQIYSMTGYSEEELLGNNILDFVVLEFRKPVLLSIRSDSPQAYDTVIKKKNEEFLEVEVLSRPFSYKGRSVRVAAIRDLSYKKYFVRSIEESEEKFRQLAEHSTDAIVLMNQYMVLYTNASFDRIFGFSGKKLTGPVNYLLNCVHSSDKKYFADTINSNYFKSEHKFEAQYRIVKPDGSIRWIWNRCFPIYNSEGLWIRQVMVISYITNQKLLENDLYKSKAQLQAILDNIPYWAWLKDNKGKYVMVNQPFADNFHTTTDRILDKTDYDLYAEDLARKFEETDKEVIRLKKRILFQEVEDYEGELKWSETFKTPIFNEAHEIIGITGIARDITNRKKSELALKFSEEKYKELVTLLPEMVFETDVIGNITFLNLRGFELFEYTNEDFAEGINLFDMLSPEDVSRAKINMSRIFDGMKVKGEEYNAVTKTGKSLPVIIYADRP
ncbi:MAG: PAS domain S-box protein [Bacteroidetes bacterium]|nr:PAS domain S-box protein [Bacteroidota bacterium]